MSCNLYQSKRTYLNSFHREAQTRMVSSTSCEVKKDMMEFQRMQGLILSALILIRISTSYRGCPK